jgi:hypothetical protein
VVAVRIDGVRGAGRTLGALVLRSRVRLTVFPSLCHDEAEPERLLEALARRIGQIR